VAAIFLLGAAQGLLLGLVIGAKRRRTLTQERNEARDLVVMFNGSAQADDLAEVGPVTPPRGQTPIYDQDAEHEWVDITDRVVSAETTPGRVFHCPSSGCNTVLDRVGPDSLWCPTCETWCDPPEPPDMTINVNPDALTHGGWIGPEDIWPNNPDHPRSIP
jgi:hypothetical protein